METSENIHDEELSTGGKEKSDSGQVYTVVTVQVT
jgi:hypothetical protein